MLGLGLGISIPAPAGVGQVVGFSPLDLSPVLWLDAADTSTITESGGSVSQWDDKSGNGYHVTQGTAANQPTSGTRTINGRNVLDFDGGDIMKTVSEMSAVPQPYVWFMVVEHDTSTTQFIADAWDSTDRANFRYLNSPDRVYATAGGAGGSVAVTINQPNLIAIVFNGTSSLLKVDGGSFTFDAGAAAYAGAVIGAVFNNTANLDGAIAETILTESLTAAQIADTEAYLAAKWGITI